MPWASNTLSSAAAWSSQPSSYDMPEQPPPTTRIRRPHSGLPSSRRSSETFFAAVSVIVTIAILPIYQAFPDSIRFEVIVSQDAALRQQGQLLERGARRQGGHEHRGPRDVLGAEHPAAIRRIRNRVPKWRIYGAGDEHSHPDPLRAKLLREHPAEADHSGLGRRVDGGSGNRPLGGHRRDIDDGAPALPDHDRQHGAARHHHR